MIKRSLGMATTGWKRALKIFLIGSGSILAILVLGLIAVGHYMREPEPQQIPFASAGWKSAEADPLSTVRAQMIDDLLSKHPLKGMTKKTLDELLGPGTVTDKWREWHRIYVLMPVVIDHRWLVIKFDKDIVSDYAIVED